jgi:hypothetical protein
MGPPLCCSTTGARAGVAQAPDQVALHWHAMRRTRDDTSRGRECVERNRIVIPCVSVDYIGERSAG